LGHYYLNRTPLCGALTQVIAPTLPLTQNLFPGFYFCGKYFGSFWGLVILYIEGRENYRKGKFMKHRYRERHDSRKGTMPGMPKKGIHELEEELRRLSDGNVAFRMINGCPPELRRAGLEDALAFESIESGISLFDGLQAHGLELPRPEVLDERQSAKKVEEVIFALLELHIVIIGFEGMSAREFYKTLWEETLWEGCYVPKKYPGSVTIIDVSRSIPKAEILKQLDEMMREHSIH
jgi:hypothetical protein